MAYVRPDMAGLACSEDVLRVVPNPERIPPGYLYAFLSSTYGVPLVVAGTYGAIIQHIEPEHIANLPVPRFGPEIEAGIHATMDEAAKLLSCYQRLIREATHELFRSVGLRDISATEWHSQDINIGFEVDAPDVTSLRALNFNPRFLALKKSIERDRRCNGAAQGTLGESDPWTQIGQTGQRETHFDAPIAQDHHYKMRGALSP
jgi:hypothetical protein